MTNTAFLHAAEHKNFSKWKNKCLFMATVCTYFGCHTFPRVWLYMLTFHSFTQL